MDVITTWVKQIIVFILIATIIELLIPANKMKKYVHLVMGLLLLLIFVQPLLVLFSNDFYTNMQTVEQQFNDNTFTLETSEQNIEKQKSEIQAEQAAYILSEVKDSLINYVKDPLFEQYQVEITNITFEMYGDQLENYQELSKIFVTITMTDEQDYSS